MRWLAGVDIGNSTTEVCIAQVDEQGHLRFISSGMASTTGTKGTIDNVVGIMTALTKALHLCNKSISTLDIILLNKAAPVIGDTAMETITETIITESSMIGHNPSTPGGMGLGIGIVIPFSSLSICEKDQPYIVVIPKEVSYEEAAQGLNQAMLQFEIVAAIMQKDEGVLVYNRLHKKIPIVDEVKYIEKIPYQMLGVVEVAPVGKMIQTLSNPYGIASIFQLNSEETRRMIPVAKSLVGNRSAVVIRTPKGGVEERIIPAGTLQIQTSLGKRTVQIDEGALEIMKQIQESERILDIQGEVGTHIGGMLSQIKTEMALLTEQPIEEVKIKDLFATDTFLPVRVQGGLGGETYMEKGVGIAAMVKTQQLPMDRIAKALAEKTGIEVKVEGVEGVMASLGALTTPGTELPLAILDLGGGSTDAALLDVEGKVSVTHLAGAGDLITMLIDAELGLENRQICERIKRNPLAKVESLFHIRMENGEIQFFSSPLSPKLFGQVVLVEGNELHPLHTHWSMEKIALTRQEIKKKVFVQNILRGLQKIAPEGNLKKIPNVVLVGGSALDFEVPEMILEALAPYRIVAGRGQIRHIEGPRNAVATGLILSYVSERKLKLS